MAQQQQLSPLQTAADKEKERDAFRAEVKQNFETLVGQGLEPNDAAALAIKLAAKIGACVPLSLPPHHPSFQFLSDQRPFTHSPC